ncbi:Lipoprotein [Corallococcus soli]|nr:hypothetical protein [Corallococcus soli]
MDETYTDVPERSRPSRRLPPLPNEELKYESHPLNTRVEESRIVWNHNRLKVSVMTMVLISLATFFIPLFNGLLAGVFGGFHAGRPRRALGAALATAIVVPGALYTLFYVFGLGSVRIFSGLGFTTWSLLHAFGLFVGAITGAASRPMFSGEAPFIVAPRVSGAPLLAQGDVAPTLPEGSHDHSRDLATTRVVPPTGPVRGE